MVILGARWRTLNESTKKSDIRMVEKYNKMAADDKVRAAEEMETYVPPSEEEWSRMDAGEKKGWFEGSKMMRMSKELSVG